MIYEVEDKKPVIDKSAFITENSTIIGDVTIAEFASIWFQTVIRGDINSIKIGKYTNVQDLSVVHVQTAANVVIGEFVTVGHRSLIHGCKIGNNCLIGMGSIIMDNAEIGDNCIVGAGSLITEGTKVPTGSLIFGSPARVRRNVTSEEIEIIKNSAMHYYEYSEKYRMANPPL